MSAVRDNRTQAAAATTTQHLQVSGGREKNLVRGNSVVTLNQIYQHQNSIPIRNRILSTAKSLQQQSVDFCDEESGVHPFEQPTVQTRPKQPAAGQNTVQKGSAATMNILKQPPVVAVKPRPSLPTPSASRPYSFVETSTQQGQRQLPPAVRVINVARRYRRKSRQLPPVDVGLFDLVDEQQNERVAYEMALRQGLISASRPQQQQQQQQLHQSPHAQRQLSNTLVADGSSVTGSRLSPSHWSSTSSATSSSCSSPTVPNMKGSPVDSKQHKLSTRTTSSPRPVSPAILAGQGPLAASLPAKTTVNLISMPGSGERAASVGLASENLSSGKSPVARRRILPISPQQSFNQRQGAPDMNPPVVEQIQQPNPATLNRQMSAATIRQLELTQQATASQQHHHLQQQQQQQQQVKKHRKLPQIPSAQLLKQQTIGANMMSSHGPAYQSEAMQQAPPGGGSGGNLMQQQQQQQQQQKIIRQESARQELRVQSFPLQADAQQQDQVANFAEMSQLYQKQPPIQGQPLPHSTLKTPAAIQQQRSAENASTSPNKRAAAWQTRHTSGSSGTNSTDTPSPRSPHLQTAARRPTSALATNSKLSTSSSSNASSKSPKPLYPPAGAMIVGQHPHQHQPMHPMVAAATEIDVSSYFTFDPSSLSQGDVMRHDSQLAPMRSPDVTQQPAGSLEAPATTTPRGRRLSSCGLGLRANFLMNKQHAISEFTPPRSLESSHSRSSTDANWPAVLSNQSTQQQLAYDKQVATAAMFEAQTQFQLMSSQLRPETGAPARTTDGQIADPGRMSLLINRRPSGHGLPQRASSASDTMPGMAVGGAGNSASGGSTAGLNYGETGLEASQLTNHLLDFKVNPATRSMIAVQTTAAEDSMASGQRAIGDPLMVNLVTDGAAQHNGGWQTWRARHNSQQATSSLNTSRNHDDRLLSALPMQNALSIDVYKCNSLEEPHDQAEQGYSRSATGSSQYLNISGASQSPSRPDKNTLVAPDNQRQRLSLVIQNESCSASNSIGHLMPIPQRDRQPSNVSTSSMPAGNSLGGITSSSIIASSTNRILSGFSFNADESKQRSQQQTESNQPAEVPLGRQSAQQPARKFGAWVERIAGSQDDDSSGKLAPRARSAQLPQGRDGSKSRASKGRRSRMRSGRTQRRPSSAQFSKHGGAMLKQRREPAEDSLSSSCLSSSDFSLSSSSSPSRLSSSSGGSKRSSASSLVSSNRSNENAPKRAQPRTRAASQAAGARSESQTSSWSGRQFSIVASGARKQAAQQRALQLARDQHGARNEVSRRPLAPRPGADDKRDQLTLDDRLKLAERSASKLFRKVDLSPQRGVNNHDSSKSAELDEQAHLEGRPGGARTTSARLDERPLAAVGAKLADRQACDDDLANLLSSVDRQRAEERRSLNQSNGSAGRANLSVAPATGPADREDEGRSPSRAKSVLSGVSLDRSTSAAARAIRRAMTLRTFVRNLSRRTSSCDEQPTTSPSLAMRVASKRASSTAAADQDEQPAAGGGRMSHLLSVANDIRQRRSAECLLAEQQRSRDSLAGENMTALAEQQRRESIKNKTARLFRRNSPREQQQPETPSRVSSAMGAYLTSGVQHGDHVHASGNNIASEGDNDATGANRRHRQRHHHEADKPESNHTARDEEDKWKINASRVSISGASGAGEQSLSRRNHAHQASKTSDERSKQLARMKSVITAVTRRLEPLRSIRNAAAAHNKSDTADQ